MALAQYRLENSWHPLAESASGGFTFTLVNLSGAPLKDFRIVYVADADGGQAGVRQCRLPAPQRQFP